MVNETAYNGYIIHPDGTSSDLGIMLNIQTPANTWPDKSSEEQIEAMRALMPDKIKPFIKITIPANKDFGREISDVIYCGAHGAKELIEKYGMPESMLFGREIWQTAERSCESLSVTGLLDRDVINKPLFSHFNGIKVNSCSSLKPREIIFVWRNKDGSSHGGKY